MHNLRNGPVTEGPSQQCLLQKLKLVDKIEYQNKNAGQFDEHIHIYYSYFYT